MSAKAGVAQRSHKPGRTRANQDWQEFAQCRDRDPEIFHDITRAADAIAVCRGCVVQAPCRSLRFGSEGVWGGEAHYPRPPGRPKK